MIVKQEMVISEEAAAARCAAHMMKKGGIVVYPTESSYGIGCDATNRRAVRRVCELKGRSPQKALPVIVASETTARKYYVFDDVVSLLVKKFMPGPLTVVARKKNSLSNRIGGFRIPPHPLARAIARAAAVPVVATSANISGKEAVYKIKEIMALFEGRVDLVVDAGNLPCRRASTVFDTVRMTLVRRGPVSGRSIRNALKSVSA